MSTFKNAAIYDSYRKKLFKKPNVQKASVLPSFLMTPASISLPFVKGKKSLDSRILESSYFAVFKNIKSHLPTSSFSRSDTS